MIFCSVKKTAITKVKIIIWIL